MKTISSILVLMSLFLTGISTASETYPQFGEDYWRGEKDLAVGKIRRGVGLTVFGALSILPSVILIRKSVDNPERYLAWSGVMGIATIGMTGHGIGSIGFGGKQRDQALEFLKLYAADPATVDLDREWDAYVHDRKKTALKVILFGTVLSLQGAILVTNGIVLNVKNGQGVSIGGATIWPSYLVGGLLLAGGATLVVGNAKRFGDLDALSVRPVRVVRKVSFSPYYFVDPENGGQNFGMAGIYSF